MKGMAFINFGNCMTRRILVVVSLVLCISVFPITAQTRTPSSRTASTGNPLLDEGIRFHDAARDDPEGNLEKGKEILASLKDSSVLALAYYGSIITIEAGVYANKKNVIKAMSLLSDGTKLMDDAVQQEPDNADIRFLRMINSYEVTQSSPHNRYKIMKKDIDWFAPREDSFGAAEQGIIELYRGLYCVKAHRLSDALSAFDACIAISPGSPEAEMAERQIAKYEE